MELAQAVQLLQEHIITVTVPESSVPPVSLMVSFSFVNQLLESQTVPKKRLGCALGLTLVQAGRVSPFVF